MENLEQKRSAYYDDLANENLGALWVRLGGLVPSEPTPKALPYMWSYANVRKRLLEAGDLISAEEAERRVVVLDNPGLQKGSRITDTMYAGLQLILPGEVAPAHRHTQSALRFVMEGTGAFTAVAGERTQMHPGDFIITPAWEWHDHGSNADGPVVWLDGLDVPLISYLGVGFREEHNDKTQLVSKPAGYANAKYGSGLLPTGLTASATSPLFSYPYDRTREALHIISQGDDPDPHIGFSVRYVNPTNGDWAIPTIGTEMRLLPKGFRTSSYRSTDGAVAVLVEGAMKATVGGKSFSLAPKDILALPLWTPYEFEATEDSVFFLFSDRPVHQKLGVWREHRG